MFAIIRAQGKQYMVKKGDSLVLPSMDGDVGAKVSFDEVLLIVDDKKFILGKPLIKGAHVLSVIKAQGKGEKIHVRRYKSKVRYRKHIGFRASITTLEITEIVKA